MTHQNDCFRIPADERVWMLHISGGRTSAYMLRRILDAHDGTIPENARAVFTNTGKERPETMDFLREIMRRWQVEITWLEYRYDATRKGGKRDPKNTFRVIEPATASMNGEPFAQLIRSRKMLPNVAARICTSELKVSTAERWARAVLGWRSKRRRWSILGMRADEPKRVKKAINEECRSVYPLALAGVTEPDVMAFWRRQPFDLQLEPHEGNCDLCFLKGIAKLKRLINADPARADWWIEQERYRREHGRKHIRKVEMAQFLQAISYSDLREVAVTEGWLPLDDENEKSVSCFCGD